MHTNLRSLLIRLSRRITLLESHSYHHRSNWELGIGDWGLGTGDWGLGIGDSESRPSLPRLDWKSDWCLTIGPDRPSYGEAFEVTTNQTNGQSSMVPIRLTRLLRPHSTLFDPRSNPFVPHLYPSLPPVPWDRGREPCIGPSRPPRDWSFGLAVLLSVPSHNPGVQNGAQVCTRECG